MKPRIGIPLIQSEINGRCGWVAGFYFVKNCLNAIATLPAEKIPDIILFVPDTFDQNTLFVNQQTYPWLTIVTLPEAQLTNPTMHDTVENTINEYQCNIFFPFHTIPKFLMKGKSIGWIPDFQDRHLRHYFSEEEINFREISCDFITHYCERIICTSYSVFNDLQSFYPDQAEKCSTIHFRSIISANELNRDPQKVLKHFNIDRNYIYLPNQFWVHKNHKLVFEAWNHLKKNGHDYLLVCTGAPHDYRFPDHHKQLLNYINEHNLQDNIRILGFIDRKRQIQLFRAACAILQPSLFEGWSTSIEDAKLFGKPLLVSNIPVHHEQCGIQATYFDPFDPTELANAIHSQWETFSRAIDLDKEKQAYNEYQRLIQEFGEQLVNLFLNAFHDTKKAQYPLFRYTAFLSKQLALRQKDCDERLALINELDMQLKLKDCVEKKSIIKKVFSF
jgi:glycosyltransferase involved in cell wall biosynthesis